MPENHRIITRGTMPSRELAGYCCLCGHALFKGDSECGGCSAIVKQFANPDFEDARRIISYTEKEGEIIGRQAQVIRQQTKLIEVLELEVRKNNDMCSSCGAVR